MENDQLLEYFFGKGNLYSRTFSRWIGSSERFKSFTEKYKNKVRRKLKEAQKGKGDGTEALEDVLYELHMACLMLRCDRFTDVEYEKHGVGKKRSPDFTVTFETGTLFNVEVKRIRECIPEVRLTTWKRQIEFHFDHSVKSSLEHTCPSR